MIVIHFLQTEIAFAVIWFTVRIALCIRRRSIDWRREAAACLMYVNLAVVLRFTLFPLARMQGHIQPLIFDRTLLFPLRVNLIPFKALSFYSRKRDLLVNVIGNIILLIPSGMILPQVWKKLDGFWRTAAAGALISLCIEIMQLPFAGRASDIDDIIMNTAGAMIGYVIYALICGKKTQSDRKRNVK